MPRSIDRAALDRMTMMTMMMTRGDDGDDDPSPQIHIISHKVRHGPTRNMMESMVRHRPTTAHATCIFFSTESDSCESGKCASTLHAMWLPNTQQHRSRSHRRNTNDLQGCQSQALDPQPHAAKGDASDTSSKERNLDAANHEGYLDRCRPASARTIRSKLFCNKKQPLASSGCPRQIANAYTWKTSVSRSESVVGHDRTREASNVPTCIRGKATNFWLLMLSL